MPVWPYDVQIWECAKSSNVLQRFQNKTLHTIGDAAWYVNNKMT